jgi:hypothetical protein
MLEGLFMHSVWEVSLPDRFLYRTLEPRLSIPRWRSGLV